jgi:isopenicillin N synthase-like dioxygenase
MRMVLYTPPKPATAIPIVDLAPSRSPDLEARRGVAWEIHKACRDTGFFYVAAHGIDAALVAAQLDWTRRFFALPEDDKLTLHMRHSRSFAGYEPLAGQTLDEDSPPDLKEAYYCGPELTEDHPYVLAGIRGYGGNQWPAALPGFRDQMLAYHAQVRALGDRLMALLALSLDLPEDYFAAMYAQPSGSLRLVHYPPQPADARCNQIGAGAHTDWGGITILLQDDIGGLEVQNAAGEWLAAPPLPGTFVINLGDLIQRWTNDLYRSNMHRVRNGNAAGRDRYSVPFFFSPDHHAVVECLPTCREADRPPRHAVCTAGEHLMEMFNRTYAGLAGRQAA